jgi:hypothetical protein
MNHFMHCDLQDGRRIELPAAPNPPTEPSQEPSVGFCPSPQQIRNECFRIQASWDNRESSIRIFRAEMACRYGVCRNL